MKGGRERLISHPDFCGQPQLPAYSVGFIATYKLKLTDVLAVLADLVTLYVPIAALICFIDLGVTMTIMTMFAWCGAVTAGLKDRLTLEDFSKFARYQ